VEDGRIDGRPVRAHGERARRIAEERHLGEPVTAERRAEAGRVEDPHVGTAHARGRELRVVGVVLPAMRGGDERAATAGAREDDVARLVADEQRADHARRRRADVDDRDAVGEMVDDPHLVVRARCHRDGLEADGNRAALRDPARADGEHLETIVRGVDGEETRPVGGEREGPHLAALELDEGAGSRGERRREHAEYHEPRGTTRTTH